MSEDVHRVRVGLVGAGYWGKNYLRGLSSLGVLAGVAETDPKLMDTLRNQLSCRVDSLDALLEEDSITAFVVATPAATHYDVVRSILSAGRDVLVEKPLAIDFRDGANLVKMAADVKSVLMVGHLLQFHPAFVRMKELVESGEIGRLQYCYSNRLNLGKIRREENVLWSFAPHDISMMLALVGEQPNRVQSRGDFILGTGVADSSITHLAFPGGTKGHIFVSWLHPTKVQQLVAIGDAGMLVFDDTCDWPDKLKKYPHVVDIGIDGAEVSRSTAERIELSPSEPLINEIKHFIECCETRSTPITSGAEGLQVLRVLAEAATQILNQRDMVDDR